MSNTHKHKDKGRWKNGVGDLTRQLENLFDRDNWDIGEFRKAKKDLEDKIAKKELKQQLDTNIKTDDYEELDW